MSVLIKGMEMPHDNDIYLRIDKKGEVYVCGGYPTELHKAVSVPPHGRLIDADALKAMWDDEIARLLEKGVEYLDYHVDTLFSDFKHDVDKMPTIIEAEEGE